MYSKVYQCYASCGMRSLHLTKHLSIAARLQLYVTRHVTLHAQTNHHHALCTESNVFLLHFAYIATEYSTLQHSSKHCKVTARQNETNRQQKHIPHNIPSSSSTCTQHFYWHVCVFVDFHFAPCSSSTLSSKGEQRFVFVCVWIARHSYLRHIWYIL